MADMTQAILNKGFIDCSLRLLVVDLIGRTVFSVPSCHLQVLRKLVEGTIGA